MPSPIPDFLDKASTLDAFEAHVNRGDDPKFEAIARMAAGVAHDFNNLLTVILSCTEMASLRLAPSDPTQVELRQVLDTVDRATKLIRTLLTIRGDARKNLDTLDLNQCILGQETALRTLATNKLRLEITLHPGPLLVSATAAGLEQILSHLVSNARDALQPGGTIRILTSPSPEVSARRVRLVVADTGCGMDAHTLERAFDPWFSTKPKEKGKGLGLSIVRGLVRQFTGTITLISRPGEGTLVDIRLPSPHPPERGS